MSRRAAHRPALLAGLLLCTAPLTHAEEAAPKQLEGVTVKEQLGRQLDLDLPFTDHDGRTVRLRDYFSDGKPVLLTLNYFRCKMLCSLQLNAVVQGLKQLDWVPGDEFRIVTISIDPRDTVKIARGKRKNYLAALGRPDARWAFLVAAEHSAKGAPVLAVSTDTAVRRVAKTVGFRYRYVEKEDQFAHPAVIFFLSPEGKVSRYLYGLEYPGREIKFALMESSAGRVGSPLEKLILSCYNYDATTGRYGPFAFGIMRLGGAATIVIVGIFLALLWRRERARRRRASTQSEITG